MGKRRHCLRKGQGRKKQKLNMSSVVYDVDCIVDYDPKEDRFRVRWKDYGPEHDTWEPWDHLNEEAQSEAAEYKTTFFRLNRSSDYGALERDHLNVEAQAETAHYKQAFIHEASKSEADRSSEDGVLETANLQTHSHWHLFRLIDELTHPVVPEPCYKILGYWRDTPFSRSHLYLYKRNEGPEVWQEKWKLNNRAQALAKVYKLELDAMLEKHDQHGVGDDDDELAVVGYCHDSDKVIIANSNRYMRRSWGDLSERKQIVAMAFKAASAASTQADSLYKVVDSIYTAADKNKMTVKQFNKSVAEHFGMKKVDKRWRGLIKDRLINLLCEEVDEEENTCEDRDEESIISEPEDWEDEILPDEDDKEHYRAFGTRQKEWEELKDRQQHLYQIRWAFDLCFVHYGDASTFENINVMIGSVMKISSHNHILKKIAMATYKWWKKFLMDRGWWLTNKKGVHYECMKRALHLTFLRLSRPMKDFWSNEFWEWLNDVCKKLAEKELRERQSLKLPTRTPKFDKVFFESRERYFRIAMNNRERILSNAKNLHLAMLGLIGSGAPAEDIEGPGEECPPEEDWFEEGWFNCTLDYFNQQAKMKEQADLLMRGINVDDLIIDFDVLDSVERF